MDNEAAAIRQQMEDTRASLTEKLESLEQQIVETVQGATSAVTDTVENVKESIHDTVAEVRETVHDTVDSVKSTFDVTHHVNKHPWLLFAGAVAAGFVAERIVSHLIEPRAPAYQPWSAPPAPPAFQRQTSTAPTHDGNGHTGGENGKGLAKKAEPSGLTKLFGDEIDHLKKKAIGSTMGFVRNLVVESAPAPVRSDLSEILDSVTTKLGG